MPAGTLRLGIWPAHQTAPSWRDWADRARSRHGGPSAVWRYLAWFGSDPDANLRATIRIVALIGFLVAGVFYAVKAADDRSAFLRWRAQVLQLDHGVNIYDEMLFPTPPIMPLILYPLMKLPPMAGALAWFALKAAMAIASYVLVLRMASGLGKSPPAWVEGVMLLFAARPILSDLHHGNNNLLILFLVVAACFAWTRGRDALAGLTLALAICCKVTPALFVIYFLWRRSYRLVVACALGGALFLLVIPAALLGPEFNGELLGTWWHRIMRPYVSQGVVGAQEVNQSMVGVVTRLVTPTIDQGPRYGAKLGLNLVSWDPKAVSVGLKLASIGLVVGLLAACRTRAGRRDDRRWLGEFALVVLTMLFVSERSWKHHYVTLLLPLAYLGVRLTDPKIAAPGRALLATALGTSAVLIALTSPEFGAWLGLVVLLVALPAAGWAFARRYLDPARMPAPPPRFGTLATVAACWVILIVAPLATLALPANAWLADRHIHDYAQGYGAYFWAGVVMYAAVAWRVVAERGGTTASLPLYRPHLAIPAAQAPGPAVRPTGPGRPQQPLKEEG